MYSPLEAIGSEVGARLELCGVKSWQDHAKEFLHFESVCSDAVGLQCDPEFTDIKIEADEV